MRRTFAALGSAIFFILAPGTVAGYVPWLITRWRLSTSGIAWLPFRIVGGLLVAAGLIVLLDSFVRFALRGLGTPAPIFPTRHLIVSGLYRYVRNPMYVSLLWIIAGQSFVFGSLHLLVYAAIAWLIAHIFVMTYEEPTLRATFGLEYKAFCAGVPRWIPRFTPWQSADKP